MARKIVWLVPVAAMFVGLVKVVENEYVLFALLGLALAGFALVQIVGYLRLKATLPGEGRIADDETGNRLDEIERRLTDVQDVMIDLSEKVDRMETDRGREKLV